MKPRVILQNYVSLDGRLDGFEADIGLYYQLAARWKPDAMLSGNTALKAYPPDEEGPGEERVEKELYPLHVPLLAVTDSRGEVRGWGRIRREPYWRDVVVLCSQSTPAEYLEYLQSQRVDYIMAGEDRVDLQAALEALNTRYGVQVVRVDSGGVLNGALLRAGLVDEVALLIHPALVGGPPSSSIFHALDPAAPESAIPLKLVEVERLQDGLVWLRYQVC